MGKYYAPVAADSATAAANTDVVITSAAVAAKRHTIRQIRGSYAGGTPVGTLEVAYGASKVFQQDIVAAGPFVIDFGDRPLIAPPNTAVTVTLKAGGSGVVGKLNVDRGGTT